MTTMEAKATDCRVTATLMYGSLLASIDWLTILAWLATILKLVACIAPFLGERVRRRLTRLVAEKYPDWTTEQRAAVVEVLLDVASSTSNEEVSSLQAGN